MTWVRTPQGAGVVRAKPGVSAGGFREPGELSEPRVCGARLHAGSCSANAPRVPN